MDYKKLLDSIQEKPQMYREDNVLIVDSMNTFIRSFSVVKTINARGQHTGGLSGFLRSLGFLVRTLNPTRVICVFDGRGGSISRQRQNPDYKANRDNVKVTNWGMYDTRKEEQEAMASQISRLFDYLECLPVSIISISKVEADDTISYLAQEIAKTGGKSIIVSSDKDFLQIVRPGIEVYQPIKKVLINEKNVSTETVVHPTNYLNAKALVGDSSDNLNGVPGLGLKTLLKEFPELVENTRYPLEHIFQKAAIEIEKKKHKKIYDNIVDSWDAVELNYKIMNLHTPRVSNEEKEHILEVLKESTPRIQRTAFLKYLEIDLIPGITKNTDNWLDTFLTLTKIS